MDLPILKIERKNLRTAFSLSVNKANDELCKDLPDLKKISVLEKQLKDKFSRLAECQKKITENILQTPDSEKEYENDFVAAEEYRDKYLEVMAKIENMIVTSSIPVLENENEIPQKRNFKLPKIEFKKFSGDAKEYLQFWSQFEKIHEDKTIPDSDKFQYLIQSVVPNSRAARVVDSFPPTAANYSLVINQIKERFGREDMLVQVYIRDLLSMVMKNAVAGRVKRDLPKLYDELEGKLRSLSSLGRTQEKYGDFLIPLVESILPEEVLISWERKRSAEEANGEERSLKNLMGFLKTEVQSEEMVALARSGFGGNQDFKRQEREKFTTATASALLSTSSENQGKRNFSCIFCEKKHFSSDCKTAQNMSLDDKKKCLMKKRACFSCFKPNHTARNCRIRNVCIKCKKSHHFLMCSENCAENITDKKKNEVSETSTLSNNCKMENVYLMTLNVKVKNETREQVVRAIIDSASQNSYVSKKVVESLHLVPKRKVKMTHCLFGGRETSVQMHSVYDIVISDLNDSFSFKSEVFSENKITGFVPKLSCLETLIELKEKQIALADLESADSEINLLLGADLIGTLFTNNSMRLNSGLFLLETRLGYVLSGKSKHGVNINCNNNTVLSVVSLYVKNASISELWDMESIGIRDPVEKAKDLNEHFKVLEDFKTNVKILPGGRYQVDLPFKSDAKYLLPSNREMTSKRHKKMCERTEKGGFLDDYKAIFDEWEDLKIIEKVTGDVNIGHFLPHRPVVKMDSATTKIRPVFDASAREHGKCSLNDLLYKGPNLIEQIPDIIDRFRMHRIGLSGDIEKAFLQIDINPEHRDFLRFYYPSLNENIVYRHCRVVFGVSSSPFLLAASISHLLDNVPPDYEKLAEKLKSSFYVDNCVTGVSNVVEQNEFIMQAKYIMSRGSFNLRNWESNVESSHVSKCSGVTKLLGILWDLDKDMLKCNLNFDKLSNDECFTKRLILSSMQKIFDPIGMLCPATLPPKILLQQTWKLGLGWDSSLPDDIQRTFKKWFSEIILLENVQIPRYVEINESTEMHVFVDACKEAYAACIFFRTDTPEGVKVQLIRAKTRVAPIKRATIPRLELIACTIGARLAHSVLQALCVQNIKTFFWSDSMVALYWLKERGDWSVFVSNRVKEIKNLFPTQEWRHVPGKINPADRISRGCSPKQLLDSRWWEGPSWLKEEHEKWPITEIIGCETPEVASEKRNVRLCHVNVPAEKIPWYAMKFSKFESIIRLVAWVLRFISNVKSERSDRKRGKLSVEELEHAEKTLILIVQNEFFPDVDSIPHLTCFRDEEGVIRIRTRISERIDTPYFISPILLPGDCIFTTRLIEQFHKDNCHAGTHILLNILREKYWIHNGRKTVRKIVNKCIPCKRFKVKSREADPVPLPSDRIRDTSVFEVVGIDLAGPFFVKNGEKVWMVLYTCAIYRAIHLELVSSLSTDSFLLSLRRFIARRGRPRVIYSDNGTNLRGANNELSKIDWNQITQFTDVKRIIWKFNPPSAAWWGGWWERLIRVIKELLRRTLGKAVLTLEELHTILCDCESTINSRPLTYQSENSEDLIPITPAMFLVQNSSSNVIDIDAVDSNHYRKRLRYRTNLLDQLRKRFRTEYLGQLIQKRREIPQLPPLKLGEVVLIGDDNQKRLNWPLAKIIELIPGRDGKVRTVKLKTLHGVMLRPIQRVFPLEISSIDLSDSLFQLSQNKLSSSDEIGTIPDEMPIGSADAKYPRRCKKIDVPTAEPEYRTRAGRLSKRPDRLNLSLI